jgi:hypothetical protein
VSLNVAHDGAQGRSGWISSIVLRSLGLIFVALVGLLVAVFARAVYLDLEILLRWERGLCTVIHSEVVQSPNGYERSVEYRYLRGTEQHSSTQIQAPAFFNSSEGTTYETALRGISPYRPGSEVECRIDPTDPTQSVLEFPWPFYGLFFPIPVFFFFIAGCIILSPWLPKEKAAPELLSEKSRKSAAPLFRRFGWLVVGAVGALVAVLGYALFTTKYLEPSRLMAESAHWSDTQCKVVTSRVLEHSSDDGTVYSVDILYEYSAAGEVHRSNRFNFLDNRVGGRRESQDIVNANPPGSKCVVYFDPLNPGAAVLERGGSLSTISWLLPLVFIAVGGMVLILGVGRAIVLPEAPLTSAIRATAPQMPGAPFQKTAPDEELVIGQGRIRRFIGCLMLILMAAIWNGFIGLFVVEFFLKGRLGWGSVFPALIIIPFVAVGLLLIAIIFPALLGIFSPILRIKLRTAGLRPGGRTEIDWTVHGTPKPVSLEITIEGQEEATYERGTDTTTDIRVFAVIPVAKVGPAELSNGSGRTLAVFPPDTVPTFRAPHNAIRWYLRAKMEVPRLPDVSEEHELKIASEEK